MKIKNRILILTVPAVFVLDQLTKLLVESYMHMGQRIPIIPGFFDIVHFRNAGAAFGIFAGLSDSVRTPFFLIVAAIATLLLGIMYRSLGSGERLMPFALSLVFGGIAGNIVDRLRHGSVVDFISFHLMDKVLDGSVFGVTYRIPLEWPAFNVADSAITVAMALIIYSAVKGRPFDAWEGE